MPVDRLAPAVRPSGRPAGFQRWRDLLFLHWEIDPAELAGTLPDGLELDTYEGRAYAGLVAFTMRDVVPWWSPSVPGVSHFHELNLRTYVIGAGEPGVWFFSLDAANALAVTIARTRWRLPYFKAAMHLEVLGERVRYASVRRWPAPLPAHFAASYAIGEALPEPAPGSFEHFLVERYLLFARGGCGTLLRGQVHHRPYPVCSARVDALEHSMLRAAGLSQPGTPPHVLYSPGVDVDIFSLRPV
jgi:uncharacterized protein YqjF (DUF2071 family)